MATIALVVCGPIDIPQRRIDYRPESLSSESRNCLRQHRIAAPVYRVEHSAAIAPVAGKYIPAIFGRYDDRIAIAPQIIGDQLEMLCGQHRTIRTDLHDTR